MIEQEKEKQTEYEDRGIKLYKPVLPPSGAFFIDILLNKRA